MSQTISLHPSIYASQSTLALPQKQINITEDTDLAIELDIRNVPTVALFR